MAKNSLVFFGTEDFSAVILSRLLDAGYGIKAVATKPDAQRGRGKQTLPPAVKTIAGEHGIPVLQPEKLNDAAGDIAAFGCQYAVLAAYGKIVPKSILNMFPGGIINVHPSLLPKYRGPSPIESAILNGDQKTGVSLMQLVEAMDAGPVYIQQEYPLSGGETRPELHDALAAVGADMLARHLPAILSGELAPEPQDETQATYCPLIKKSDGVIDWRKPAAQIERAIRAYLGWPGSRTQLFGQDVTLLEVEVSNLLLTPGEIKLAELQSVRGTASNRGNLLIVGAGDKSLAIKKLRPAGRSSMGTSDFLRGLRLV